MNEQPDPKAAGDGSGSNLVLTGFMGTGKTAVGRTAASLLQWEFVDTDAVIEDRHGPIPEIFARDGESAFRAHEAGLAAELAERRELVISTGGGMLLDAAVADRLGATGRIFCLTASPATILDRVRADGISGRPLLDGPDPELRIAELLEARAEHYGRFEAVATEGRSIGEIVADVLDRFRNG